MKATFEFDLLFDIGDTFFLINDAKNFNVHKYVVIGYRAECNEGFETPYASSQNSKTERIKYLRYFVCDENGYGSYFYDYNLREKKIFKTREEVEEYLLETILPEIFKEIKNE